MDDKAVTGVVKAVRRGRGQGFRRQREFSTEAVHNKRKQRAIYGMFGLARAVGQIRPRALGL